jgi:uncharacterized membrane protein YedE/YeeE
MILLNCSGGARQTLRPIDVTALPEQNRMNLEWIFNAIGEPATAALGGLLIGVLFGFFARRSRFCLRSAVIDLAGTGESGTAWNRLAVWLLAFGAAIAGTQMLIAGNLLDVDTVRQLTSARSLSGVLIGGLLFGVGMGLARGCVSRLTVLSAGGNLRALYCLVIFAAVAWAAFDGALAPLRGSLLTLWILEPGAGLNVLASQGQGPVAGAGIGVAVIAAALVLALNARIDRRTGAAGLAVGASIAVAWWFTWTLSGQVFEPVAVESISFTRPAIDLAAFGAAGFAPAKVTLGIGLLAGVLAGSFAAALVARDFAVEWFDSVRGALRYTAGAALMGFGGVLAGGCSVGAGLTGGSLFALAPLLALAAMAVGTGLMELALRRRTRPLGGISAHPVPAE